MLATLVLAGCAFEEADLRLWKDVQNGEAKLAGYMADPSRPPDLRFRAARYLYELDRLDSIMGVVNATDNADRRHLIAQLSVFAAEELQRFDARPEDEARAVNLSFQLLRYGDAAKAKVLAVELARWSLKRIESGAEPPSGSSIPNSLMAAAVVAPESVNAAMIESIERVATGTGEGALLTIVGLADQLRDEALARAAANALLSYGRRMHPKLTPPLVAAMKQNGNPTLMLFLLEAARDPRMMLGMRGDIMSIAVEKLGKDATPGLLRLLQTDEPEVQNAPRWEAFDHLWQVAGHEAMAEILGSMPATGRWPSEGTEFKAEVDNFCDQKLAPHKASSLPALTKLLESRNWVARTFATNCVIRLFPDEAPDRLATVMTDEIPLPGWSSDGTITLGEFARQVLDSTEDER